MAFIRVTRNALQLVAKSRTITTKPLTATVVSGHTNVAEHNDKPLYVQPVMNSPFSSCSSSNQGDDGKLSFGSYEPWSEDMACILQGSCMPGSTRYCRTNSMFGKISLGDISQSSLSSQRSSFHTLRQAFPRASMSEFSRNFSLEGTKGNGKHPVHLWSEDIACILQGTCLPGSTKYCRTTSMFGNLAMSDVNQGTNGRPYSTSAPEQTDGQWA